MIEIKKGDSPPNLLATHIKKSTGMKEAYNASPDNYINQIAESTRSAVLFPRISRIRISLKW